MMPKICKPEYQAKVKLLTKEETERLLSRMSGKLPRRLEKDKLSKEDALAIQMELEDEQLHEWRNMMSLLKKKDKAMKEVKTAVPAKTTKAPVKAKVAMSAKTPLKVTALKQAAVPKKAKVEQGIL